MQQGPAAAVAREVVEAVEIAFVVILEKLHTKAFEFVVPLDLRKFVSVGVV